MTNLQTGVVHTGDAAETLRTLPESSVHMVMTSPPYWQLRDYGEEGQLGLEETAEEFVDAIADVCDEIMRVLRPDGSLWLNLGDTYDDKDKQLIPERVAIECQSRGWILRNDVTWHKPNPMPNSVKDRLNTTTEEVFHLVPQKSYYYDLDAIREEYADVSVRRATDRWDGDAVRGHPEGKAQTLDPEQFTHPRGKNPGDVFEVTTKPFPDAHFAVYPPELCEKPIKATCPSEVCAECGSPYERVVERDTVSDETIREEFPERAESVGASERNDDIRRRIKGEELRELRGEPTVKGWRSTCDCDTDATEPGVVLDPFAGAGTTLLKAKDLGRRFVGIELSAEYADMARKRVGLTVHDPSHIIDREDQTSFAGEWSP